MKVRSDGSRAGLYIANLTLANRLGRLVWQCVWLLFFRPTPNFCHGWRRFLLRIFGASIGPGAHPYPSCKIWAPWNLTLAAGACLGPDVRCYSVGKVVIGCDAVVSQNSHLCAATHDYRSESFQLYAGDIYVGERSWVCADAFIGPGVTVASDAVINSAAVLYRNAEKNSVYAGNPAVRVRARYSNEKN